MKIIIKDNDISNLDELKEYIKSISTALPLVDMYEELSKIIINNRYINTISVRELFDTINSQFRSISKSNVANSVSTNKRLTNLPVGTRQTYISTNDGNINMPILLFSTLVIIVVYIVLLLVKII